MSRQVMPDKCARCGKAFVDGEEALLINLVKVTRKPKATRFLPKNRVRVLFPDTHAENTQMRQLVHTLCED